MKFRDIIVSNEKSYALRIALFLSFYRSSITGIFLTYFPALIFPGIRCPDISDHKNKDYCFYHGDKSTYHEPHLVYDVSGCPEDGYRH